MIKTMYTEPIIIILFDVFLRYIVTIIQAACYIEVVPNAVFFLF